MQKSSRRNARKITFKLKSVSGDEAYYCKPIPEKEYYK